MIRSFRDREAERLFRNQRSKVYQRIERSARRKLKYLDAAETLEDLAHIPGHHLECLKGDRQGQYSIRVNDQYRICFRWEAPHALDVESADYH